MKRNLFYIFIFISSLFYGQIGLFINGSDASFRVDSTSFLSVDGDFENVKCDPTKYVRFNGPLYLSGNLTNNDLLKFTAATGSGNAKKARLIFISSLTNPSGSLAVIGGTVEPKFWEVELDKGLGAITLSTTINCFDTLNFKTGLFYMNGFKWNMVDPSGAPSVINHPYLKNERHGAQFMPVSLVDTGLVIYKTIYSFSLDIDPGNIGIKLNGLLNTGSPLNIFRGFIPQVNAGKSSIQKYFDIYSPGHSLVNNTITTTYALNDMSLFTPGYLNLSALKLFVSENTDANWSRLASTIQNTLVSLSGPVNNGRMTANLADLNHPNINNLAKAFRITIADPDCSNPPISALTADTLHLCAGTTTTLDAGNNSTVPNASLRWEWNTTPVLYSQTFTVNATNAYQKYVVKLTDARGCETVDSVVIAPQAPYPQITYLNHLNACLGDSVLIKDTVKIVSGSTTNSWLFSDGSTSSTLQKLFKKKFNSAGDYNFQLTATSNFGCSVSATSNTVIVYPLPTAGFTHSLNCSTGLVSFSNTSVSNHTALVISSSSWSLGQGASNTSTLMSPSQTYSMSGNYIVELVATSSYGCKDSVSTAVIIFPSNQAHFTKNNSCSSDTVFLNNNSACNTGSCSYVWTFGDATQSTFISPKKVYSNPGLYTVKLKVTNPLGCPDSSSASIFINPKPSPHFVTTTTNVCINNFIYFTNTSALSSGSISSYSWNFGNTSSSTTTNAAVNFSNSGIYTISLTAQSDSGCVKTFTLPVIAQPQPTANYAVSNSCFGSANNFISSSIGPGLSYAWNFGNSVITNSTNASTQNYIYPSVGNYTTQLIVFNTWGCSDTASAAVSVFTSPVASLGGSVSTCGSTYTLNANNSGSIYLWQPGNQTTQTVQVSSNGVYQVNITNTNNCVSNETVQVTLNATVNPHLGNDTAVCGPFILNAGYPGSSYFWNTSATSQTILASSTGVYNVQITDQNGCIGSNSITLIVNTPASLFLGNDLMICKPKYGLVLSANSNAVNFLWSNGITTPALNIFENGSYWLEGTAVNGCKKRDTILVNFLNTPQVELGPDKSACGITLLDAQNNGCSYLWNTNETNQTLNASSSGSYWVVATNTINACTQQDSITIIINPWVSVTLGNDTTLCNNSGFFLNAGNPGSSYAWVSNQTTQTISITSSGVYGVTVTNNGGCSASDYVSVTLIGAPVVDLGTSTRYLCGNNSVDLQLLNTGTINWGSSLGLISHASSLSINQPGKYWVNVSDFGCNASDSVLIVPTTNTILASFLASTIDTLNKPVKFVNLSSPAPTSQLWTFGDGLTSTELSPIHSFVLPQDFSVTLEVSNGFCSDKITKQLSVLFKQSANQQHKPVSKLELLSFKVFPNPTSSFLNLDVELNDYASIEIRIFDVTGKLLVQNQTENSLHYFSSITTHELANGVYILNVRSQTLKGEVNKTIKFIKAN